MASRVEQLEVTPRQSFEKPLDVAGAQVRRLLGQDLGERRLVVLDHLVGVRERQEVVGVDVEAPEQLFLPRRERFAADGLDIGQRHEAQHLKPVFDADQFGELPDDLRILGVAPERCERHLQVMDDEELDGGSAFLVEVEPIEHLARHPRALGCMVFVAPFPDVVVQERQHEQLGPIDLLQETPEALPSGGRFEKPLEVADRQERVLVDGVLVVEVAHDAAGDRFELREHLPEQPEIVHVRQPRVEPELRLEKTQQRLAVARRRKELLGREPAGVLLHAGQGVVRHGAAVVEGRLKHGEPRLRAIGGDADVDELHAVGGAHQILTDRRRRGFERPAQRAIDRARVAEVVAHQALDPLAGGRPEIAQAFGRALLQLVAEHVVMPPRLEVQDRAHAQQKLLGVLERAQARSALAEQHRVGQLGNRLGAEQIAKPSRRLLQVGLELIERVVEARVAFVDEPLERVERARRGVRRIGRGHELIEERRIADDGSGIGQREQEFRIVVREARIPPAPHARDGRS